MVGDDVRLPCSVELVEVTAVRKAWESFLLWREQIAERAPLLLENGFERAKTDQVERVGVSKVCVRCSLVEKLSDGRRKSTEP